MAQVCHCQEQIGGLVSLALVTKNKIGRNQLVAPFLIKQ